MNPQEPVQPNTNPNPTESTTPVQPTEPTQPVVSAAPVQPVQPPAPEVGTAPQPASTASAPTNEDPGHTLGIIGLILAFFFPLVGFIVSLIARSKSKKAGHKNTIATIGIFVNLAFMVISALLTVVLVLASFKGVQTAAKDIEAQSDINSQHLSLESFYATNKYYPARLDEVTKNTSVVDTESLTAPAGYTYTYIPSPAGCTQCSSYTLETTLLNGEKYTKEALGPAPSGTSETTPEPLTN